MKFTITEGSNTYTVKTSKLRTNSNYNIAVSVFRNNEKSPLFGTTFREYSSKADYETWVLNKIKIAETYHPKQETVFSIYNKSGDMTSTGLESHEVHYAFIDKNLEPSGFIIKGNLGHEYEYQDFKVIHPL